MSKRRNLKPPPSQWHEDGSLITPFSKAVRAASKKAGFDRDKDRPTNSTLDRLEGISRAWTPWRKS